MTEKRLELVRGLGAWASAAIVVGTMIGTGIFLKPAEMAREGRSVSVVFAAWIVGAILSIFGAFSFAELGAIIPEAGGEYAYLRRGFGPVYGFLFGWTHSIVGRPSSLASIAAGMMRFLSFLFPAVAAPIFTIHIAIPGLTGWIKPYDFVFTWAQPLAVGWLLIMTGVNYLGVRLGGAVQVFLTTIKIMSVVIVIGVAFFAPAGRLTPPIPSGPPRLDGGDLQRVSRHAGCRSLGLRRMGRLKSGRLRSRKPATQFPPRTRRRSRLRRRHLSCSSAPRA